MFTFLSVLGNVGLGLFGAVLINMKMPNYFLSFLRFSYFFPVIVSLALVSIVWRFFYDTDTGLFNYFFHLINFAKIGWLNDTDMALFSIIMMDVWKNLGFCLIIFLAGLQNIPKMYYEAASIDGASKMQSFFRITLPLLTPSIFVNVTIVTIGALQVFESIYLLTQGGPGDATRSIVIYIYEKAFQEFELGYGSAVAIILMILILIVTLIQIRFSKRWVHY